MSFPELLENLPLQHRKGSSLEFSKAKSPLKALTPQRIRQYPEEVSFLAVPKGSWACSQGLCTAASSELQCVATCSMKYKYACSRKCSGRCQSPSGPGSNSIPRWKVFSSEIYSTKWEAQNSSVVYFKRLSTVMKSNSHNKAPAPTNVHSLIL